MTFTDFQAEIETAANDMQVEVFLSLWSKIKALHADKTNPDIQDYINLIEIYTHCKIFRHRLNRWVNEAYVHISDGPAYQQYNRWLRDREKCDIIFQEMKYVKQRMRDKLTNQGVSYKKYHPHIHHLDMRKVAPKIYASTPSDQVFNYMTLTP